MSLVEQYNVGTRVTVRPALINTAITQSSAAAPAASTGHAVDRNESGMRRYYSCAAVVSANFTAATTAKTVSITCTVQHSSDGTSWDNYSTATNPTAALFGNSTGNTGGTVYPWVKQSVNLNGARRYIRIQVPAPTFSDCSSGSTLAMHAAWVFGGGDELPAV